MDIATAVEKQFRPAPQAASKIGVEVELIAVTDSLWPQPVDPARLAAGFDASFVRAARPSFEPGGQLELSPRPRPSANALIADLDGLIQHAVAIAEAQGVRLEAAGTDPYHSCAEVPAAYTVPPGIWRCSNSSTRSARTVAG